MITTKAHATAVTDDLQKRLRRIEGQVRGVQRMLDDDRECREIIQQLSAIRAAVGKATTLYMQSYAKDCLLQFDTEVEIDREELIEELVTLLVKVS